MCRAVAIAFVALVVGCNTGNERKDGFAYSVEANPGNFPPSQVGGRTWIFHASPSFDASEPGRLREYVSEALQKIDLPPVTSVGKPAAGAWRQWSEGLGEYQFVWSIFDWSDYSEGPLEVRTGALAKDRKKNRVIFICVNSKKQHITNRMQ
jgi:hypothetical protein